MKTDKIQLKAINHLTYTVTNKTNAAKFWRDILGVEAIPKQVDSENLRARELYLNLGFTKSSESIWFEINLSG